MFALSALPQTAAGQLSRCGRAIAPVCVAPIAERRAVGSNLNQAQQCQELTGARCKPWPCPAAKEPAPLSIGLTQSEVAELQRYLALGPAAGNTGHDDGQDHGAFLDDDSEQPIDVVDEDDRERVYLVGVEIKGDHAGSQGSNTAVAGAARAQRPKGGRRAVYSIQDSLEELGRLADTAGLQVLGSSHQSLETPNNATYIGSGKVAEVARAVKHLRVETVIFDDTLSPGQLRNLEKAFGGEGSGVKVCDRTALILDIFSQRAGTREGKLQVELAQTEYQLPRLTRMWTHLDRVGGGGQVKGAGEKQIETDKRLLRDRAGALRKELESVRTHRRAYRERRQAAPIPVAALVGYTNAGKSTLLNRLTAAGVVAEDKLFATLDPTTRKIRLKGNREALLTDTVGFIQKLPTELVAAFRATLEEIRDASVLVHVVDISHHNAAAQCETVLQVLEELGISDIPIVTAWNKLDCCVDMEQVRKVAARRRDTVCISGLTGEGVPELLQMIAQKMEDSMVAVDVLLPYGVGDLLDDIHRAGSLQEPPAYLDTGVAVKALVPKSLAGRLARYSTLPAPVLALPPADELSEGMPGREEDEDHGSDSAGLMPGGPGQVWVPGAASGGESSVDSDGEDPEALDVEGQFQSSLQVFQQGWPAGGWLDDASVEAVTLSQTGSRGAR